MAVCGVYAITHSESGRRYIGSSVDVHERWMSHRSLLNRGRHPNIHLQRAWAKYGDCAFSFEVLASMSDRELLEKEEQRQLERCQPKVYNMGLVAASPNCGVVFSAETRKKMSLAKLGRLKSEETKRRMSLAQQRQHPPVTIRCPGCGDLYKISPSRLRLRRFCSRQCSEMDKKGRPFPGTRYSHSGMARPRQSVLMRAVWADPAYRSRLSQAQQMRRQREQLGRF